MTKELYKVYRPKTFKEVIGQSGAIGLLRSKLKTDDGIPHSILFHGPSGCGKTTLARILRKQVGCKDLDFEEINSSQFRGIDTVRDIQRKAAYAPIGGGRSRVWLLDEVHKLSNDAQNGILKLLEDTPSHAYFFLCTTDPGKLLSALRNRCTEIPLALVKNGDMQKLLEGICDKEGLEVEEEVLEKIIEASAGSPRKALVLLDSVSLLKTPEDQIEAIEKAEEKKQAIELCRLLFKKPKWKEVAKMLREDLKDEDPEGIRRLVLAYANSTLLARGDSQSFLILQAFRDNYYDCGKAGLTLSCYEVVEAK